MSVTRVICHQKAGRALHLPRLGHAICFALRAWAKSGQAFQPAGPGYKVTVNTCAIKSSLLG